MDKLNEYLQSLVSTSGSELRLEPNKNPYVVSDNGTSDVAPSPLLGTQISMMIFPLIPQEVKQELPSQSQIEFIHPHNLGKFNFTVKKSPAGFNVTVRLAPFDESVDDSPEKQVHDLPAAAPVAAPVILSDAAGDEPIAMPTIEFAGEPEIEIVSMDDEFETPFTAGFEQTADDDDFTLPPVEYLEAASTVFSAELPPMDRRNGERRKSNVMMTSRMDALFNQMAEVGASDLHMSVSMAPMIRKDGKMMRLECSEQTLLPEVMCDLLQSIMPEKNREEFEKRHDTDFAYEIPSLARFRCNIFMDRKGMGGVFRIIPTKILTAEQLSLSKAIMDLCSLSKGLVVVTGPTGSGKSTTLCAMVDSINKSREDHIITIEDPIEFVHDNHKCLVNQREVHNHTDSFKDALRAALREDPDILLVGEMRDLETISIAIETAETGHLVFGTLHTTTAASTVDRIIDQFPADRQQQIRVMLSESLKGVIAQTLLPKKGGGRVAALEVLIVTPAISNLIREGKTFQIPSAMQTGKSHGMQMLNDSLFDLVNNGIVEPRDAYIKAVDKTNFETMLTRGGFKI